MQPVSFALLLFACAAIAPLAQAQRDYSPRLRFSILGAEGHTYVTADSIATQANGILYASDLFRGTIRTFSPDGSVGTIDAFFEAGGGHIPVRIYCMCIAVDGEGNTYAATRPAVFKISPAGMTTMLADDFSSAQGIAVDGRGNVYVADTGSHVIYKISSAGVRTVLAGNAGQRGNSDGTSSARFDLPSGIGVDSAGNVYVADWGSHAIRRITPEGVVSTLAGLAGVPGGVDGTGAAARFDGPYGLAVDVFGTVYTTESGYRIRRITPGGVVTTINVSGGFEGEIESGFLGGIAVDRNGTLYVSDAWYGAILASPALPGFTKPLASQRVAAGGTATFSIDAVGVAPIRFQWMKEGVAIPDATSATLTIENIEPADVGNYSVRATNAVGAVVSNRAALSLPVSPALNADGLVGFSVLGHAGPSRGTMILGFGIHGGNRTDTMPLLMRGVGPSLGLGGVPGALADPTLTVYSGRTELAVHDNWNGNAQVSALAAQVGAVPLASATSRDAAFYHPGLAGGVYTVELSDVGAGSGLALAEIYDASPASSANGFTPRLTHVSARTQVRGGTDSIMADFTVGGAAAKTLLIRAIGPTLGAFGVTSALADPRVELLRGATLLRSNDNWGGDTMVASAAAQVGAFPLEVTSRDAALVVLLQPGSYTVRVGGVADSAGVALVEIYEIP